MTRKQRHSYLTKLPNPLRIELASRRPWWFYSRPEQREPANCRRWWVILAGRGWGKSLTGAEWIAKKARDHPGARCALIGVTFSDVRDTMVEGETGLLAVLHPSELRGGTVESAWNRSLGELYMANGSRFKAYSSERPRQVRGPQFHYVWGDEPSYWDDASKGTARDSTFTNANFALRLRPRPDWVDVKTWHGQGVLTMTPRLVPLLKVPDAQLTEKPYLAGLLQRADVTLTHGSTMENIHNLADEYRQAVIDPMVGTTLGRQELDAELLEDVEGALWSQKMIEDDRVLSPHLPLMNKIVVAFDPSGGAGLGHDEMGIVVSGSTGNRITQSYHVINDLSFNGSPNDAVVRCIRAALDYDADAIVYEKNQGQDWIPALFESVWMEMVREWDLAGDPIPIMPSLREVTAYKGKKLRAQPVVGLYEQHRVHHIETETLGTLEGQMTTWVPDDSPGSPDRIDALVYSILWLQLEGPGSVDVASPAARDRRGGGRRGDSPSSRMPVVYGERR